jgi:hypothetical protein
VRAPYRLLSGHPGRTSPLSALAVVAVGIGASGLVARAVIGGRDAKANAAQAGTQSTTPDRIGFGTPTLLSRTPSGGEIDDAVVAISPTGSTAVLWREASGFGRGQTYRADYMVALGPDAAHLSRPRPVRAARTAAKVTGEGQLLALPDGGFVACFTESGRRHGAATSGCTFAAPGKGFGPLRVVERVPWGRQGTMSANVRADGTLLLLITHSRGSARRSIEVASLTPTGQLTTLERLGEVRGAYLPSLATTDDGTVAIAWSNGPAEDSDGGRTPVLRLMPSGSTQFGPPVAFGADRKVTSGVALTGGSALVAEYEVGSRDSDQRRIVGMLPDGTFTPPKTLPRPGDGFLSGSAFALPDGTPFAVVSSDVQSETDCSNSSGGSVGVGPLVDPVSRGPHDDVTEGPVTAQRLSDPRQIAQNPSAGLLADGTVIVAWNDSFGDIGQSRIEVTSRRPGAASFSAPQVLPRDTVYGELSLGAGADQALLAWIVGPKGGPRKDVVVSALRAAPPFATQRPRPAHPGTPCA